MLDQRGYLAIAELVFYTPVLPVAVLVAFKHGFAKSSGWFFLILLAVIRIIGTAMTLAVETESNPPADLIPIAAMLSTLGLSPLILCTIGILNRLHSEMPRKPVQPRIFFLLGAIPIAALVLSIVGGVRLSSGNNSPSQTSTDVNYLGISSILYIVVVVLLAGVAFMLGINLSQALSSDRKLFYAVVFSLPFLLVRSIYSVISAFNYTNTTSPFNSHTGSIFVQAFMATLEEFIVVLAYLIAGFCTPKTTMAVPAADKLNNSDFEQGYPYQRPGNPHQQPGYPMQPYPGQQTGSVGA